MCKSRLFRCCLVALSMFGLPALAQTPDGQTPAQENVCDPLKSAEVTKGLYGLCVAYCEARDNAESSSRSRGILANYNRKKRGTDPDMPCIQVAPAAPVAPPCPCWTNAQASAVDGVLSDGSTASGWSALTSDPSACGADPTMPYIMEAGIVASRQERTLIQAVELPSINGCQYWNMLNGTLVIFNSLSIEAGNLTAEGLAACKADVFRRQAALRVCQ